jgi:predicted ATP-grasp superfamily ATP-dependent carboligase
VFYPDPKKNSREFVEAICRSVKETEANVLLPVTDVTTLLVTEKKEELEKYCAIPFPEYKSVFRAADKSGLMRLAEGLDIAIPKTFYLERSDDLEAAYAWCRTVGYPIVVKPSRSRFRTENGWGSSGVRYAVNVDELKAVLSQWAGRHEYPLLLQERIYGEGVGLFLCMDHREAVAAFSHKRLREKPPSGGVSVLRESIPVHPVLRDYSERLLRALKWRGVAMVEFKKDDLAGDYKLMEVNGRFWGSLQLAIDAGVDFPSILVRIALGETVAPIRDYKVGVKTRWLWGDIDALLLILMKSREVLRLPIDHPGRLQSILRFMRFWGKDLHYEVLDCGDIRPWVFETRSRFFRRRS